MVSIANALLSDNENVGGGLHLIRTSELHLAQPFLAMIAGRCCFQSAL